MSDRVYLFLVGLYMLVALYLELHLMVYLVVGMMLIEGITGWTLPLVIQKLRKTDIDSGLLKLAREPSLQFSAFRMMRLSLAIVVLASYLAVHEYNIEVLWFFPWFVAFAVLGAGVSGVCPVYLALRWLGFK